MRFSSFFFAALANAAVLERSACNANNCARAVTGTRDKVPNEATRRAQCSSFMLTTVTPDVTTITITNTAIITQTNTETEHATVSVVQTVPTITATEYHYERRAVTVSPSIVPAYASACSGSAAFSSACSCWGITATVTTAPTPTAYTTTTVTVTQHTSVQVTVTDTATSTTLEPAVTTVPAQCPNSVIGCQNNFPRCPGSMDYCFCGLSPQGQRQCFRILSNALSCLIHTPCTSNADCDADSVCITGDSTCCRTNGDQVAARCWQNGRGTCVSEPSRIKMMLRNSRDAPTHRRDGDEPIALWTGP